MRSIIHLRLWLLAFLTFFSQSITLAQGKWPSFELVHANGNQPLLNQENTLVAFDSKGNKIWLSLGDTLFSFDLKTKTWEKYSIAIDHQKRMFWVEGLNELRVVDDGVGRVWRWKPRMDSLERIDKSFNHKNQFGFYGTVNPKNGTIYAFGGYGLFTYKDFLVYFSQISGEWELLLEKAGTHPPPLGMGTAGFYESSNEIVIVGGLIAGSIVPTRSETEKAYHEIWRFNLSESIWKWQAPVKLPPFVKEPFQMRISQKKPNAGVSSGLGFSEAFNVLFEFAKLRDRYYPVIIDLTSGRTWLDERFSTIGIQGVDQFELIWSKTDTTLFALVKPLIQNNETGPVLIYRSDMREFLANFPRYLDELHTPPWQKWVKRNAMPLSAVSGFLVLSVIGFVVLKKRREHTAAMQAAAAKEGELLKTIAPRSYSEPTFVFETAPAVFLGETDLISGFTDPQKDALAALLLSAKLNGGGVESDELDDLIEGRMTQDYLRKTRSLNIQKLNSFFKAQFGIDNAVERGPSPQDKRRIRYFLSAAVVEKIQLDVLHIKIPARLSKKSLFTRLVNHLPPEDGRKRWFGQLP
jgi:hypothetical protein